MAIQLQQMHPAFVHFPIAVLPVAVGADLLGCATGNKSLFGLGQKGIGIAALGALASAATGLIAGEEVNAEGETRDMLMTHRNLNFVATVVIGSMALWRAENKRPNAAYLGAGLAATCILACTAYLGGKLVYDRGVGVGPARGVWRTGTPVLRWGQLGAFFETAATDLWHGVRHMIEEVRQGKLVPTLKTWWTQHDGATTGTPTGA